MSLLSIVASNSMTSEMARPKRETSNFFEAGGLLEILAEWAEYLNFHMHVPAVHAGS
jgi:hypothetical protein